jgi:hypothetical protein
MGYIMEALPNHTRKRLEIGEIENSLQPKTIVDRVYEH